ncbi:pentatricopeptide repeat-containing protein At2g13600-like [Euphorbia lathyris]|uniref:pentatricopeptide repeat-containing protein At2g13600-like n=1 Tax=Euphorbia lathyris TaxID=212925 RepID=UPI00331357D7
MSKPIIGDLSFAGSFPFSKLLDFCVKSHSARDARRIHARIIKTQFASQIFLQNRLIDAYGKCASLDDARKLFDKMPDRNTFSWNSMITTFMNSGFPDEAARLFSSMPVPDQCSWNSIIAGFAQHDRFEEALGYFIRMHRKGFVLNEYTFGSGLCACSGLKDLRMGSQIHALMFKSQFSLDVFVSMMENVTLAEPKQGLQIHDCVVECDNFRDDLILSNALVDMYAKCGRIDEARYIFDRMRMRNVVLVKRNVVSWNALIAGYIQNGESEEALVLFRMLKRESISPTHYTFGNILNACANLADLQLGRQAHTDLLKQGYQSQHGDVFVGNSLLDMYMKCGSVEEACQVFEKMVEKNIVSWNAMIVGYSQNGYGIEAIELFKEMLAFGEKPDKITMIGVLSGCRHGGLVEEGRHYFMSMSEKYGLVASEDHYTCMVDLLGRAGCLDEAKKMIERMPIHMKGDAVIWGSLVSACKVHKNMRVGEYAAEKLLEMKSKKSGGYVLISNMYAEFGRWEDVVRVRKVMKERGVIKEGGCSWIEILGSVHVFMVKDKTHSQTNQIYVFLKMLTNQMKKLHSQSHDMELLNNPD